MSIGSVVPRRLRHGALRGVWQWTAPAGAALLEGAGADLEWHTVLLDTVGVDSKESFLQACAQAFALPEWFGMNWDALEECLGDLDVGESMGILVGWSGWESFAAADPGEFETATEVLRSATTRWAADGVPGAVVLLGGGQVAGVDAL